MDTNAILQIVFSGTVAVSTIFYVILTAKLVKETRKTREMQITPNISVYLEEGEADITFLYIVFQNIGFGVAKDVSFKVISDIDHLDNEYNSLANKGIIKKGLKFFYPGQKFRYLFLHRNYNMIDKDLGLIELEVNYTNILGKKNSSFFTIDFKEFDGTSQLTPPNSYVGRISYELGEIRKILKK